MRKNRDSNYISLGFWMFAIFVSAIPIIGWIMIIVWAFVGENESRKNYFRAILAWFVIAFLLALGLILLGTFPVLLKQIQSMAHKP